MTADQYRADLEAVRMAEIEVSRIRQALSVANSRLAVARAALARWHS